MAGRSTPWDENLPSLASRRLRASAERARQLLAGVKTHKGKIDLDDLDRIMIQLRDGAVSMPVSVRRC